LFSSLKDAAIREAEFALLERVGVIIIHHIGGAGYVSESDGLEFRKKKKCTLKKKKGRSFYQYLKLKDSRKYNARQMGINDKNFTYNIILRRFLASNVSMENQ